MRTQLVSAIVFPLAILVFSSGLAAQSARQSGAVRPAQGAGGAIASIPANSRTQSLPFDHHDLSGFWQIQCRAGCTMTVMDSYCYGGQQ
jgi:hypothetical protein